MEKQRHRIKKRLSWTILAAGWVLLALVGPGLAEEKKEISTPGEAIGDAVRRIREDSKAAYHDTKDAVVKTSDEVVEGAKKAFHEAKEAGGDVVTDVKKGFTKEPGETKSSTTPQPGKNPGETKPRE